MATSNNNVFLKEKLDELAKLRKETENGLIAIDIQIKDTECEAIRKDDILMAVGKFTDLFDTLQPYQKKDIMKLIMKKAVLNPEGIKIALIGKPPKSGLFDDIKSDSKLRCQTSIWLPREGSNLGHTGYDLTYLTTGVGLSLRPVSKTLGRRV